MKLVRNGIDITNHVSSITWAGSSYQSSRTLDVTMLYSPKDKNYKHISIKLGDILKLYDDKGRLLIAAMVYSREATNKIGTTTYNCKDDMERLLKSEGTYNFKNTTAERIASKVCNDIGVSVGRLAITNVPIKKLIIDKVSMYTIIMKAYSKAHMTNGKKYLPLMVGRKFNVIPKGQIIENFTLDDSKNIIDSSYQENIDSLVNKVKIYDDKGNQIGVVSDESSIKSFGIFQAVYSKKDGVNHTTGAKELLQGKSETADITCLGNVELIAGYGVRVKDSATNLVGTYWIENDSHTWQNGTYQTSLTLEFKNLMQVESISDSELGISKSKKKKTDTDKAKAQSEFDSIFGSVGNYGEYVEGKEPVKTDTTEPKANDTFNKAFGGIGVYGQ